MSYNGENAAWKRGGLPVPPACGQNRGETVALSRRSLATRYAYLILSKTTQSQRNKPDDTLLHETLSGGIRGVSGH